MLRMGPKGEWEPPIVRTSTVSGDGLDELWDAIEGHRVFGERSGELERKRRYRVLTEVQSMVAFRLGERAAALLDGEGAGRGGLAADLAERRVDPYRAADILLRDVAAPSAATKSVGEADA
jgi:LAO/AO transport system kinase